MTKNTKKQSPQKKSAAKSDQELAKEIKIYLSHLKDPKRKSRVFLNHTSVKAAAAAAAVLKNSIAPKSKTPTEVVLFAKDPTKSFLKNPEVQHQLLKNARENHVTIVAQEERAADQIAKKISKFLMTKTSRAKAKNKGAGVEVYYISPKNRRLASIPHFIANSNGDLRVEYTPSYAGVDSIEASVYNSPVLYRKFKQAIDEAKAIATRVQFGVFESTDTTH